MLVFLTTLNTEIIIFSDVPSSQPPQLLVIINRYFDECEQSGKAILGLLSSERKILSMTLPSLRCQWHGYILELRLSGIYWDIWDLEYVKACVKTYVKTTSCWNVIPLKGLITSEESLLTISIVASLVLDGQEHNQTK